MKGGGGFCFLVSSSGLESEAERYYLVDVMQIYIYIYRDGRYALVCSALYIQCTRERTTSYLGNKAFSTD